MNMNNSKKSFFAVKGLFCPRTIAIMAMMMALKFVLAQISIVIPVYNQKLLSLAYLPGAMVSIMYGPVAGLIFGFVGDFIGYIANPFGPYFPGYAISEMLANFYYALLLYQKEINFSRVIIARLLILFTITFGLNFIWNMMMMGSAASTYFTGLRFINNAVQFPFHVLLVHYFGKLCLSLEKRRFAA